MLLASSLNTGRVKHFSTLFWKKRTGSKELYELLRPTPGILSDWSVVVTGYQNGIIFKCIIRQLAHYPRKDIILTGLHKSTYKIGALGIN